MSFPSPLFGSRLSGFLAFQTFSGLLLPEVPSRSLSPLDLQVFAFAFLDRLMNSLDALVNCSIFVSNVLSIFKLFRRDLVLVEVLDLFSFKDREGSGMERLGHFYQWTLELVAKMCSLERGTKMDMAPFGQIVKQFSHIAILARGKSFTSGLKLENLKNQRQKRQSYLTSFYMNRSSLQREERRPGRYCHSSIRARGHPGRRKE